MADSKLTALTAETTFTGDELVFVVDDPSGTPVDRKATIQNVVSAIAYTKAQADAAYQPLDADLTALAAAGNSATLAATTASFTTADETKLDGIEALADVTDATNVDAAGAVMNSDTSTAAMSFVVDEDNMASDSATKVPTQQSVKAYVDAASGTSAVTALKSAAETVTASTTLQADDHLSVAVEASVVYALDVVAVVNSPSAADIKFSFAVPSGATVTYAPPDNVAVATSDASGAKSFQTAGADVMVVLRGFVIVGATPGDVTLQWAQLASDPGSTTVKAGSYMRLENLGPL